MTPSAATLLYRKASQLPGGLASVANLKIVLGASNLAYGPGMYTPPPAGVFLEPLLGSKQDPGRKLARTGGGL